MEFLTPALAELTDQQVRYAPAARRREQVSRAATLLGEIDPQRSYPYPFVCYRITDFKSANYADLLIPGADLVADLTAFIRLVGENLPAPAEGDIPERMYTLDELSQEFNVSTKTIGRWRVRGLVGQRATANGRRQLGYPKSLVERFLAENKDLVERGRNFSRLDGEERTRILYRARRLAQAGGDITEVCRRVARRFKRSVEAIRYTVKNFDRECPQRAIFPDRRVSADVQAKEMIFQDYERGVPVETLSTKYNMPKSGVYQAIGEIQARLVMEKPVEYIHHESFELPENDAAYTGEMPGEEAFRATCLTMVAPKDVPAEMQHLYRMPLITKDQEQHLFRKMNYLKYRINKLRETMDPAAARAGDLKQLEVLHAGVRKVRDRLIGCNTRLVASIAKKHANQFDNLPELMSDGAISLMRAVEKFDYSRGNKFSTYATWAIMKNFARSIPDEKTHRERYVTGHEDMFEARPDVRTDEQEVLTQAELVKAKVSRLLDVLDPRTRDIIRMRNGLDGSAEMTLEQIGRHFGITKERVRQINVRGMKQLKDKADVKDV